jgi:hypothetical protein
MKKSLAIHCIVLALALVAPPARAVVTGTTTEVSYTGNGSTTVFSFPFKAMDNAWVKVFRDGAAQSSGFTVTRNTNQDSAPGGSVTFTTAPANGVAVRLERAIPLTQESLWQPYAPFKAKTLEGQLDRGVMLTQQVDARVAKAEATHAADRGAQDARDDTQDATWTANIAALNGTSHAATDLSSVLALGSTAPRTLTGRFSDRIVVLDEDAKCDGVTNDAAALQRAFNRGAAENREVVFPGGVCVTNTTLTAPSGLRVRGHGATLRFSNTATYAPVVSANGVSNVVIEGMEIDGQKALVGGVTEWKHCIDVRSSSNVTLRDLYLHDCKGDGLYIGAASGQPANTNFYVENVRSNANHRQGISITNLSGGRFIGFKGTNTSGTAPQFGLDIEPNYDADIVQGISFVGCEFTGNTGGGVQVMLRAAPTLPQRDISFTDCMIEGNTGYGVHLDNAVRVSFQGRTSILSNGTIGFDIVNNGEDISCTNCTIQSNGHRGVSAVIASGKTAKRISIIRSRVADNSQTSPGTNDGIRADGPGAVDGLTLIDTESTGSSQRYGVSTTSYVSEVKILASKFTGNGTAGTLLLDDVTTRRPWGNTGSTDDPRSVNGTGAQAVKLNVDNGSGTGGVQLGDGAGNVKASVSSSGVITPGTLTFSVLPGTANGAIVYCSDCTVANPCASGGTGALAKKVNGAWVCN